MTTDTKVTDTTASDLAISDLETTVEIETHPLHELQMAIASLPAVDADRVEAVLKKLRSGQLDILGSDEQKIASAQRIAKQILDESI